MQIIQPTSLKILKRINASPTYGYQLIKELELSFVTVYKHLKCLKENKLIDCKKSGKKVIYFLTERGKMLLKIFLDDDERQVDRVTLKRQNQKVILFSTKKKLNFKCFS